MKKLYMQGGGYSKYSAPTLETIEVLTEKGFADSLSFGEDGLPGGDITDTDFGTF